MDDNLVRNLDHEYDQFLEIMRPHIFQLKNQRLATLCTAWIQRLCACEEREKILRNKYIVTLCYQLSKGILDEPFLKEPEDKELPPINEPTFSEVSSSEVECHILDSEGVVTGIHLNESSTTETLDSAHNRVGLENKHLQMWDDSKVFMKELNRNSPYNEMAYGYNHGRCHEMVNHNHDADKLPETYRDRTNNIISKLKEIKKQNTFLHKELREMKEKSSDDCAGECINTVNTSTLYMRLHESNSTLDSLKSRLKEVQGVRSALIEKIQSMQEFIDNLKELKTREIEELSAKHKLELITITSFLKEEMNQNFENKLDEQKRQYEEKINEVQSINITKDHIIAEKDKIIQQKESEIVRLSEQIKDSKENLHSVLKKLVDRPNEDQRDHFKIQNHILEKRIIKMEKSRMKYVRAYESKLSSLQRERHLLECSLQIQLVRQRAQVFNDVADDCQNETKKAVDKIEAKYQDIVANMQATAIQRRLEDQMAVAAILQAASGLKKDAYGFFAPNIPRNPLHLRRNKNQRSDSEVATVFQGNKVFGKMNVVKHFKDEKGRFGELSALFEKAHVPLRDTSDKTQK